MCVDDAITPETALDEGICQAQTGMVRACLLIARRNRPLVSISRGATQSHVAVPSES